ncbi:flagellar basal body rod protein FlgF [Sphingosinicella microcystinivorans]|uniref:Flagellar basal-body rod protein FlgF n=1 Tax=Sphingosinicella microcystinivorans TaxID=335406 RepID=A0AAD1DCM1_SPHMI|nr:flagellar basal body rod protein FlgF [Sphingosinicella microcystinivorans]RKS88279.1 flagellar basal-body rod protein FlgF [Sphingosinicella microcystinivorans]BBE36091.1 flagellar basal body protein [Sphingosinicella microcystinivorans]
MDRLVYTALSGLRSAMAAQDVTAHNIANASTIGFKRDVSAAQSRHLVGGQSFASRIQAAEGTLEADNAPGTVNQTGRALDVAMLGESMMAVQAPDGAEVYTRRGDLRISPTGILETGDGLVVMGQGGPITIPPSNTVEIGADGTVSIRPQGGQLNEMSEVGRIKLVTPQPDELEKGLDNLMRAAGGGQLAQDETARLQTGGLEGSNVNMMGSMVTLIEQARAYEVQVQLVSSVRDMDMSSTALLRLE